MPVFEHLIELPLLKSIYRVFAAGLVLLFLIACAIAVLNFDWASDAESPAEYVNGVALGISVLVCAVIAQQHGPRSAGKVFWYVVASALLLLAANETFDVFERVNRAWADDDYFDLLVLLITLLGLYLACRIEAVPPISLKALKCGFAFQCISDLLDLGDGSLYTIEVFNRNLVETTTELTELIFIETYLFGLGCLLLSIVVRGLERPLDGDAPLLPGR
jgi:hypothetical protein